ncbi:hypothetical protein [Sphingomonas melonis]|jgi:hypothetical protein|uniref:Uncharacterized protein n=1 Tax=Sphingomonas melonis TaxID=152682 RepID=A0A7Y9K193_9SPHN|nr:hypothetical protein [Sphingomonas melonis]NYD90678.1 hypothetical protein [Sphingomonas melonis]
MRKTVVILAAAAATLTSTGALARDGERTFQQGGDTYVYTATDIAPNRHVIRGRHYPGGESFRFVVSGGRVTGAANGTAVAFRTADAKGAVGATRLASR